MCHACRVVRLESHADSVAARYTAFTGDLSFLYTEKSCAQVNGVGSTAFTGDNSHHRKQVVSTPVACHFIGG